MIRMLFGLALPILGLGAAMVLLGPDLLSGPRGAPIVVAAPSDATLQKASFDGTACALPLAAEQELLLDQPEAATHFVTLALRYGPEGASVTVENGVAGAAADAAVVLAFDAERRIISVSEPVDCLPGGETDLPARI